jgi:hypothetical protein
MCRVSAKRLFIYFIVVLSLKSMLSTSKVATQQNLQTQCKIIIKLSEYQINCIEASGRQTDRIFFSLKITFLSIKSRNSSRTLIKKIDFPCAKPILSLFRRQFITHNSPRIIHHEQTKNPLDKFLILLD